MEKSRIRDKHPGSATLVTDPSIYQNFRNNSFSNLTRLVSENKHKTRGQRALDKDSFGLFLLNFSLPTQRASTPRVDMEVVNST